MNKKLLRPLFTILLIVFYQGCMAAEVKKDSNEKSTNSTAQNQASAQKKPHPRDPVYSSSKYKPTVLLIDLDFEEARIDPIKGQERSFDQLVLKNPQGKQVALGIQYEKGARVDREAVIAPDPEDAKNRVLEFWVKNARIPDQKKGKYKGRVQLNIDRIGQFSLFQRYRIYLHKDLAIYRQFPGSNGWFGLGTMWMGEVWKGHKYPFKISFNIGKKAGVGESLYFDVTGGIFAGGDPQRGRWQNIWGRTGLNFPVPVGEWIDIEIGYKAGDKNNGRIYMAAKRATDREFTPIIDLTEWTYHPLSPEPVPITFLNPIKLYSSDRIIDFIRDRKGVARMYWDDYVVYQKW